MLLHLSYHAILVAGVDAAFALMHTLRVFYRWLPVEALILGSVLVQLATGPVLARRQAQRPQRNRVAALSGYYLFFFSIVHVAAVLWGRLGMEVDTSIHFAAAGLHAWPAAAFSFPIISWRWSRPSSIWAMRCRAGWAALPCCCPWWWERQLPASSWPAWRASRAG